jgi:hypothetical protein
LLELLGGRIGVDSAVGHGATFTVWLPLAAEPAGAEQPAGPLQEMRRASAGGACN